MSRGSLAARLALAAAAALAVAAAGLPSPLAVAALAVTFLVTPGLLAARFAFAGAGRETRFGAALALSPFLTGAPAAALLALGAPLPLVARGVAASVGLLALALPDARDRDRAESGGWVPWACAAAWTALVAALLVGNRYLPPRADGWYHAGATLQVLQRGVPPEDPYFAGIRMLYFWGIHVWGASWLALAPRLSVYTPFIAFNLSAACAVVLAVAALARRLGAGPGGVALAAGVATLGYSPFGWLIVFLKAMVGDVTGWAEITRTMGQGVDIVLMTLAYSQLHGSMAFFGDKFLVLTQFGMGMALFALAVRMLLDLASAPGLRVTIAFCLLAAAALFIHTVVGYSIVIAAGVVGLTLLPGALRGRALERRAVLAVAAATVTAGLVLAPYLLEITLGKRGQFRPGLSLPGLATLVIGGFCTVVPGFAWLVSRARRSPDAARVLGIAGIFAVMAMTLKLPENNQSKFFNILFLLLAPPAALFWISWLVSPRRLVRTAAVLVLAGGALPTAAFAVWGFATERGQSGFGWHPPSGAMTTAMAWARAHTPADAAFCDVGGGREVLTMAGRSTIWGGYAGERDYGYDPAAMLARRDLAGSLCRGRDPGPAGAALLAGIHRDVIVMVRAGAPDSLSDHGAVAARPERFELLWRNGAVAFWKVRRP